MSNGSDFVLALTGEEPDFLLSLLAAHPPASDEKGEWTSKALEEIPPDEYRRLWMALDNKLRTGPSSRSVGDLLGRSREILAELRALGVIRTDNAPAGDYAEWLVAQATEGELEASSSKSYDILGPASDEFPEGERIQVKARTVSDPPKKGQRQLSVFRSWDFDSLVAVLFDDRFGVMRAAHLPAPEVEARSSRVEHVNGWRVHATDDFLDLGDDWTQRLNTAATGPA
jgi:hypothetical protein